MADYETYKYGNGGFLERREAPYLDYWEKFCRRILLKQLLVLAE